MEYPETNRLQPDKDEETTRLNREAGGQAEDPGKPESKVRPGSNARIPIARDGKPQGAPEGEELVGSYAGPYLIKRKLSKGGMGHVFLGYDETLRRQVALKVMDPKLLADQDALKRFEREARATASVQHKNIAGVYMVGLADNGQPFLAMEFVNGGNLLDVIRSRARIGFAQVADWMEQVVQALRAAHRNNIIHRDIKPANIMLTDDGIVKVVDFGLAKIFFEDSYMTQEGMVLGTPSYMAPEQSQGRAVDHRADIYSVGATFYHLITGRAPFTGDSPVQIMMKHVTAPLVPMRSLNPDVPIEFDDIIARCMRKDQDERYQDYDAFLGDIQRVRLQSTAREQGSIIGSSGENAKPRSDTFPAPPSSPGTHMAQGQQAPRYDPPSGGMGSSSRPPGQIMTMEHEGESGWTPARIALIAGAALVVIGGIVFALIPRGGGEETTSAGEGGKESAAAALLKRVSEKALANQRAETSDYERYLSTMAILRSLRKGITNYELLEDELPNRLATVATEDRVIVNFQTDSTGTPLDGWGTQLDFNTDNRLIRSAGLDGRHYTPDDLTITLDGEESVPVDYLDLETE